MPVLLTCQWCSKQFSVSPSDSDRKYCSLHCRDEHYRRDAVLSGKSSEVTCPICGTKFIQSRSKTAKGHQCCSKECRYKLTSISVSKTLTGRVYAQEQRNCLLCDKQFTVQKASTKRYCSRDCANKSPEKSEASRKKANKQWSDKRSRQKLIKGIEARSKSPEWRNSSHFQRGAANPRYTGYREERESGRVRYEYKKWRTDVFKRDNYTCQNCYVRGGKLAAHHIQHWAKFPELRYVLSNGLTLCESCHKEVHSAGR
jgi:5-methylcytosine-specific restriction endonuclease McrA